MTSLWQGVFLRVFTSFKLGKAALLKFPRLFTFGFFSHAGPTEEQMAHTRFQIDFFARGYKRFDSEQPPAPLQKPDMLVHTRVAGPEPGLSAVLGFPFCVLLSTLSLSASYSLPHLSCDCPFLALRLRGDADHAGGGGAHLSADARTGRGERYAKQRFFCASLFFRLLTA